MHELQINIQTYGSVSMEAAFKYNAIGLFHCRMYKDYNGALRYHNKALHIITALQQQLLVRCALEHDQRKTVFDSFESDTNITARNHHHELNTRLIPLLVTTYMDIGTCYELQQNYKMAMQYYEKTDNTINRLEQQSQNNASSSSSNRTNTIVPKHIIFACRRAIARLKRL
jgi:tetratricopeptide (TPR) repeat protein